MNGLNTISAPQVSSEKQQEINTITKLMEKAAAAKNFKLAAIYQEELDKYNQIEEPVNLWSAPNALSSAPTQAPINSAPAMPKWTPQYLAATKLVMDVLGGAVLSKTEMEKNIQRIMTDPNMKPTLDEIMRKSLSTATLAARTSQLSEVDKMKALLNQNSELQNENKLLKYELDMPLKERLKRWRTVADFKTRLNDVNNLKKNTAAWPKNAVIYFCSMTAAKRWGGFAEVAKSSLWSVRFWKISPKDVTKHLDYALTKFKPSDKDIGLVKELKQQIYDHIVAAKNTYMEQRSAKLRAKLQNFESEKIK